MVDAGFAAVPELAELEAVVLDAGVDEDESGEEVDGAVVDESDFVDDRESLR